MPDRIHYEVGPGQHDPSKSLLHGCCAVCVTPWPCGAERERQAQEQITANNRPTLRDQFAMAALTGILASKEDISFSDVVLGSYRFADAMLEARKVVPGA